MHDPRDGQLRYLIHFDSAGAGMRFRDQPRRTRALCQRGRPDLGEAVAYYRY
jgi:hypothetical protein